MGGNADKKQIADAIVEVAKTTELGRQLIEVDDQHETRLKRLEEAFVNQEHTLAQLAGTVKDQQQSIAWLIVAAQHSERQHIEIRGGFSDPHKGLPG